MTTMTRRYRGGNGETCPSAAIGTLGLLAASDTSERNGACRDCRVPLPVYSGPGRPRIRCVPCATDKAALGRSWRRDHPEYNAERRADYAQSHAPSLIGRPRLATARSP